MTDLSTASPGLRAARRLVQAADRAAASGCTQLSWGNLRAWPSWAAGDAPPDTWLQIAGACWHAAEVQQCIDGARLQGLRELLGAPAFAAVLRLDNARAQDPAPRSPLWPGQSSAAPTAALLATGRVVALSSVADAELRKAVAGALGWSGPGTTELGGGKALSPDLAAAWLSIANEHAPAGWLT